MTSNNDSRNLVKNIAKKNKWHKESKRNVVTIHNEKWSVAVNNKRIECRQLYEDCVGFISIDYETNDATRYRIKDLTKYKVSRISPSGIKAYDVIIKNEKAG